MSNGELSIIPDGDTLNHLCSHFPKQSIFSKISKTQLTRHVSAWKALILFSLSQLLLLLKRVSEENTKNKPPRKKINSENFKIKMPRETSVEDLIEKYERLEAEETDDESWTSSCYTEEDFLSVIWEESSKDLRSVVSRLLELDLEEDFDDDLRNRHSSHSRCLEIPRDSFTSLRTGEAFRLGNQSDDEYTFESFRSDEDFDEETLCTLDDEYVLKSSSYHHNDDIGAQDPSSAFVQLDIGAIEGEEAMAPPVGDVVQLDLSGIEGQLIDAISRIEKMKLRNEELFRNNAASTPDQAHKKAPSAKSVNPEYNKPRDSKRSRIRAKMNSIEGRITNLLNKNALSPATTRRQLSPAGYAKIRL